MSLEDALSLCLGKCTTAFLNLLEALHDLGILHQAASTLLLQRLPELLLLLNTRAEFIGHALMLSGL